METTNPQNLKYGIIYLYSDRRLSPGMYNPEAIVEKFVYPMQIEWIDEPGREDLLLVARRFNVGNIGKYALVKLTLSRMNRTGGWFEAIQQFADALMGVSDEGDGDIELSEYDFCAHHVDQASVFSDYYEAAPQDNTRVEASRPRSRWKRLKDRLQEMVSEDDALEYPTVTHANRQSRRSREIDVDLIQEEKSEVKKLEQERKRALERIKRDIVNYIAHYHDDPKDLIAELLRGKVVVGQPGRVLVNGDLKIVLPEYDEMEIKMPAMCRTIYILFMKHRVQSDSGIILKNIDEYRDEIIDIYSMVKPGANEARVEESVNNLCDPFSDALNQTISRINRCIRNVISDRELARNYCITGERGQQYGILLGPQYLELPRAVTGE